MNRRRRLWTMRIVAPVLGLFVTLLALEGVVRLLGLETASYNSISGFCRYDPELGWNLIPEQRTIFRGRHFESVVETSAQGLRDRYYPLEREPGRRRVLVLGDSVAWCWGVEMDQCFTKLVERALGDTDVITMGVPGYSTAQELLLYEREGSRFGADLVLLVFVGNDPVDNLDARKRPRFVVEPDGMRVTNQPVARRKSRIKEWLRQNSRLFVQLDFGSQVAQAWLKRLREGREGGENDAAPGNRFVSPTSSEEVESLPLTEAILDRLHSRVTADGAAFAIVSFDVPRTFVRLLERFCAERGCRIVDSAPAMQRGTEAGLHVRILSDGHLAPEGQQILAEVILAMLREEGWEAGRWPATASGAELAADGAFR